MSKLETKKFSTSADTPLVQENMNKKLPEEICRKPARLFGSFFVHRAVLFVHLRL